MQSRYRISLITALAGVLLAVATLAAAAAKNQVSITARKFVPPSISIQVGQIVTWTNNDDLDHTVEADDGSFTSGKIKAGKTYEIKFDKAGAYTYSCGLHPREKAKVIVKK